MNRIQNEISLATDMQKLCVLLTHMNCNILSLHGTTQYVDALT